MNPLNRRQVLGMTPLLALAPVPPGGPQEREDLPGRLVALQTDYFRVDSASLATAREAGLDLLHLIRSLKLNAFVNDQEDRNWFHRGMRHRDGAPARIVPDGTRFWFRKDLLHRDDGPAIEFPGGDLHWFREGCRHRDDGPAIDFADGGQYWYREGLLHREDGPAVVDRAGSWWYVRGVKHRDDGPAVVYHSGTKRWFREGYLHREDGPAVEGRDGSQFWYRHGVLQHYIGPPLYQGPLECNTYHPVDLEIFSPIPPHCG